MCASYSFAQIPTGKHTEELLAPVGFDNYFFRRACHNIFRLEIIFDLLYWHRRKFLFRGSRYHRYFCRVQFCLKAGKKPTDRHVQRWTKNPPPSKLCSFAEMAVIISNQCRELGFVYYQLLKLYFVGHAERKRTWLWRWCSESCLKLVNSSRLLQQAL